MANEPSVWSRNRCMCWRWSGDSLAGLFSMRQEHFAKQVGGILVAGDTGRYLVSVGDVGRQLYFETMVVETVGA